MNCEKKGTRERERERERERDRERERSEEIEKKTGKCRIYINITYMDIYYICMHMCMCVYI